MPRPPKKNGFAILLFELRRQYRLPDKELIDKADGIWRSFTPEQKAAYQDRAKKANNAARGIGQNDHLLPVEQLSEMERSLNASLSITDRADELNMINRLMDGNFVDFPFIIVSVNHFLHNKAFYIPAELGISRVSLNDGVLDEIHYFFKHRMAAFPILEVHNIRRFSDENHQIPLDNYEHIVEEWEPKRLVQKVYNYIHYKGEPRAYVFAADEEVEQTRQFFEHLQRISAQHEMTPRFEFKVLVMKLSSLYYHLYTHVHGNEPRSPIEAMEWYKSTQYLYYGLCQFHEALGNPKCSVAQAQNYGWLLCAKFCEMFNITPAKGHHLPDDIINPI